MRLAWTAFVALAFSESLRMRTPSRITFKLTLESADSSALLGRRRGQDGFVGVFLLESVGIVVATAVGTKSPLAENSLV